MAEKQELALYSSQPCNANALHKAQADPLFALQADRRDNMLYDDMPLQPAQSC
jgi:hypothetical protein